MVAQEWPTCWDSQKVQPLEALEETARLNTVRLRNHPSLLWWAGGNESAQADGEAMDRLARIAFELDGTRPFRRTSPYGGSLHNYDTYWMLQDMDRALTLDAVFIGEFGMASAPNLQSVYRYIPEEERDVWDPAAKSALNYHTPRFNEFRWPEQYNDMDHLLYHAAAFGAIDSLETFVTNTQLAQAVAIGDQLMSALTDQPFALFSVGKSRGYIPNDKLITEGRQHDGTGFSYTLAYTRVINGAALLPCYGALMNTSSFRDDLFVPAVGYEQVLMAINREGQITSFLWSSPYRISDERVTQTLLPFENILTVARQTLPLKYQVEEVRGESHLFVYRIALGYMAVLQRDTLTFALTPVWNFYGHDVPEDVHVGCRPLLTVNAVDGTVIDLEYGY